MLKWRYEERSDEFGALYEFENEGDELKEHRHEDEEMRHSVRCLQGACAVFVREQYGERAFQVCAGFEITKPEFDSSLPHRIVALKPGTIVFNRMFQRPENAIGIIGFSGSI